MHSPPSPLFLKKFCVLAHHVKNIPEEPQRHRWHLFWLCLILFLNFFFYISSGKHKSEGKSVSLTHDEVRAATNNTIKQKVNRRRQYNKCGFPSCTKLILYKTTLFSITPHPLNITFVNLWVAKKCLYFYSKANLVKTLRRTIIVLTFDLQVSNKKKSLSCKESTVKHKQRLLH